MHRILYELEATHGSHPGLAPDSFLVFACEYSPAEMEDPTPARALGQAASLVRRAYRKAAAIEGGAL